MLRRPTHARHVLNVFRSHARGKEGATLPQCVIAYEYSTAYLHFFSAECVNDGVIGFCDLLSSQFWAVVQYSTVLSSPGVSLLAWNT